MESSFGCMLANSPIQPKKKYLVVYKHYPTKIMRTNEEWITLFEQVDKDLPPSQPSHTSPFKSANTLAQYIDHTLLKLDATSAQIDALCAEALKYNFAVR